MCMCEGEDGNVGGESVGGAIEEHPDNDVEIKFTINSELMRDY